MPTRNTDVGNVETLLGAIQTGDADAARSALEHCWTGLLDEEEGTALQAVQAAVLAGGPPSVPSDLLDLVSVTRQMPTHPRYRATNACPDEAQSGLSAFVRTAKQRRAGQPGASSATATQWLLRVRNTELPRSRILVMLQAFVSALEAGRTTEAILHAEEAYRLSISTGASRLARAAAESAALALALDAQRHRAQSWIAEACLLPSPPPWWQRTVGDPLLLATDIALLETTGPTGAAANPFLRTAHWAADLWFVALHLDTWHAAVSPTPAVALDGLHASLLQRSPVTHAGDATSDPQRPRQLPPLLALDLGRLYLEHGRGTSAELVAELLDQEPAAHSLLTARLCLARRRPREALAAVRNPAVAHSASPRVRIEARLLGADAHLALGSDDEAHRELAHALDTVRRTGGSFPLRWGSPAVLHEAARLSGHPVVEELARTAREPVEPTFSTLSERQSEVLGMLAQGLTATQIARQSFVSANTVKTQVRDIYRRLGVHDRASALRRAHETGLLDPVVRPGLRIRP
ncbi:helix-turn-helix domain-containing protein [Cellulosimicrobium sp. CpK407]|uniref:helix-turn-helix transcriptional regulator n=1 Tax=Cellulosimicrobium sp. CpK407 TaxID=3229847 RepID=UPI003F39E479